MCHKACVEIREQLPGVGSQQRQYLNKRSTGVDGNGIGFLDLEEFIHSKQWPTSLSFQGTRRSQPFSVPFNWRAFCSVLFYDTNTNSCLV